MIKEIQEITNKLINLNSLVHKEIFSTNDLLILENAINALSVIQKDINILLQNDSLISTDDINAFIEILIEISHLLSIQAIIINEISILSVKLIRNYREKWDIIQRNTA